jgi:RNA polymerase sigma-70 factor (ECF subfamily)
MDVDGERSAPASAALLEHRAFVRALGRVLVGGNDGEDVAQETLLAGLRSPPGRERAWRSWLRSTVRHVAANFRRSQVRRESREREAAAPERLPSTAALVQRLELEQRIVAAVLELPELERAVVLLRFYDGQPIAEIARATGAPADTVRARLRRALARLRGRLDSDQGGRAAWMAGLGAGATVMGTKAATTLVAAGVFAAAAWWVGSELVTRTRIEPTPEPGVATPATADASALPDAAGATLPAPERAPLAAEPAVGGEEKVVAALPPAGEAIFRVTSADGNRTLDEVALRLLNDQRFAEYDGGGEGRVRLTSGRWRGRVTAVGFEPRELAEFEIAAGVATDLGTFELVRGVGTIEGRVTARHVTDRDVTVELRGDGRGPCDECRGWLHDAAHGGTNHEVAIPTKCCGFDPSAASRLAVAPGGRFTFGHLAAGVYWLRAFDAGAELVDVRRVEIARGGNAWVELDVSQRTSLAIELRHANGHHFTGDWKHPHRDVPATIRFDVKLGECARGRVEATPTAEEVSLTMGPPIPVDAATSREQQELDEARTREAAAFDEARALQVEASREAADAERLSVAQLLEMALTEQAARVHERVAVERLALLSVLAAKGGGGEDRLDRERQEGDALVEEPKGPDLRAPLSIQKERPDRWLVGPLPRAALTVRVECGRFASEETPVDLRFGFEGALVVTLVPVLEEWHAALLEKSEKSCTACHDGNPSAEMLDAQQLELDEIRARVEQLRRLRSGR